MQPSLSARNPDGILAALWLGGEKPHQGVPSRNPAPYLGFGVCNSTTALGLQAAAVLNRIGSCSTGKERDTESGNDYFNARYYNSNTGRFLSPDWSVKHEPVPYAKLTDPQTLNLYSYVNNNPLGTADLDGHGDWYSPSGKKLGSDGNNNGSVVVAKPDGVHYSADNNKQVDAGGSTPMYTVTHDEGVAIQNSVARTLQPSASDPQGGMHEEGFVANSSGIQNLQPSATATSNGEEPRIKTPIDSTTTMVEHTHIVGTTSQTTMGGQADQDPSPTDKTTAAQHPNVTFVETSAKDKQVNFYNGKKVTATIPLSAFPTQ
jgi:RHS repeat-associated protein